MLTNTYNHSQFNSPIHSKPIQLVQYPQQHLGPNQSKIQSDMEYTQTKLEVPVIVTTNYGFDQNNNSKESSRLIDDMLLCRSYYIGAKLDSCLAIDCLLSNAESTLPCLSSSSSTTSTSSSSTSLNLNEPETKPSTMDHLTAYSIKKNSFIFKNVNKNVKSDSPCISSSSECLSSDEGYVGSYSEHYDFNKLKQNLVNASSYDESQENVDIQIPALFALDNTVDVNSSLIVSCDELDLTEKCFPKIDEKIFYSNNWTLYDELTSSFTLEPIIEIQQLFKQILSERLNAQKIYESEMASSNWRNVIEKRQQNALKEGEFSLEDECDLNAYLNEIDMNLDYSHMDQIYLNSNSSILSSDLDQYLKFSHNKMAFNLRKYHEYLFGERIAKKSLFANIQVDSIAEFVPVQDNESYTYEENYEVESNEYDLNEPYLIDDAEYTMIECDNMQENSHNFLIETTMVAHDLDDLESSPNLDYDANSVEYEDYEDQIYIDSLTEEEAISLLRNESEIYALQMSQAAKYGLLDEGAQKRAKKSKKVRLDSGQTDDLSKADIFDSVFNYDEHFEHENFDYNDDIYLEGNYLANSNLSASLRNSLLNLRKTRRHLTRLLDENSKKMSSNCSTGVSSTSSSFTTSHIGLYKQHMASQSKKPCMYMLTEGRCLRSDCRFVHDFKTITCKYWLEGECLKGESCEFLHEIVECEKSSKSQSKKAKKEAKARKDFKLDTEEFPALGLSAEKPKQASPKTKSQLMANVVKKSAQKKETDARKMAKEEKKSAKKSEHKARAGKNTASTPVIQITLKPNKQAKKSSANSCGSSLTSSGSSSATSSRANSKIRVKK